MKSLKQHLLLSALLLLFSGAASAQTTTQERAEEPEMAADTRERPMRHSIEQRRGEHLQRLERGRRPTVRQRPTLRQRRVKAHRPGIKAAQNPRIAKKNSTTRRQDAKNAVSHAQIKSSDGQTRASNG